MCVKVRLTANPQAFGRHLLTNLGNIPGSTEKLFFSSSSGRFAKTGVSIGMLLLFASIILYAWRAKAAAGKKSWLISQIKKSWFEIFVVLILLLPGVISVLVIYPRSHYLLVSWVLFGFAIIVLLTKGVGEQERRPYEEILLICGLALLLVSA